MELPLVLMFMMVLVTSLSLRRQQVPPQLAIAELRGLRAKYTVVFVIMVAGGVLCTLIAFTRPKDLSVAGILLVYCIMMANGLRSYLGRLEAALQCATAQHVTSTDPANNAP